MHAWLSLIIKKTKGKHKSQNYNSNQDELLLFTHTCNSNTHQFSLARCLPGNFFKYLALAALLDHFIQRAPCLQQLPRGIVFL